MQKPLLNGKIVKAVIPAAGLGERWYPVSKFIPKEMFPVGPRPAIEWVVREALAGGCEEIAVIISPRKLVIREYLAARYADLVEADAIRFLTQEEPRGLGGAIYLARDFCGRDNFLVLLPDTLAWAGTGPPVCQMSELFGEDVQAVISVTDSSPEMGNPSNQWELRKADEGYYVKATQGRHPDRVTLAGFGRYLFRPDFFHHAEEIINSSPRKEISDGMILNRIEKDGEKILLRKLDNACFNIGCLPGYAAAVNHYLHRGDPY